MRIYRTYFSLPYKTTAEVKIFGLPYDLNTSCRFGAYKLPIYSRLASYYLEEYSIIQKADIRERDISDHGNLQLYAEFERNFEEISGQLENIEKAIFVGGDHSITILLVAALKKRIKRYVHLDAHADSYPKYNKNPYSHASVLRRISELIGSDKITLLGVRTLSKLEEDFLRENNIEYYSSEDISNDYSIIRDILRKADYISIDLDLFDPSKISDVSCPEPFGIDPKTIINTIPYTNPKFIDIVEGCPEDEYSPSAITTATIIREFAIRMSQK